MKNVLAARFDIFSEKGISIKLAQKYLTLIENSREWIEVNLNELSFKGLDLRRNNKIIGKVTPVVFQQVRRHVGARKHQIGDVTEEEYIKLINKRLQEKYKIFYLRISKAKKNIMVIGATTAKYEHLKYTNILYPFPKNMKIHRLHCSYLTLTLNIMEEKLFSKKDNTKLGFKIITSDNGNCKIKIYHQLFNLKELSGLHLNETIADSKKVHSWGIKSYWNQTVKEKIKRLKVFKQDIASIKIHTNKDELKEDVILAELLDLNLPRRRIVEAIAKSLDEYEFLSRWSIANAITHISHESRICGDIPTIQTINAYDEIAVNFLMKGFEE